MPSVLFQESVSKLFESWPALNHAIESRLGGITTDQKVAWLPVAIDEYFSLNPDLECFEIEDMLSSVLWNEFDLSVEDGSIGMISQNLKMYYEHIRRNQVDKLNVLLSKLPTKEQVSKKQPKIVSNESSSESDEEEMDDVTTADGVASCSSSTGQVLNGQVLNNNGESCLNVLPKNSKVDEMDTSDSSLIKNQVSTVDSDGWTMVSRKKTKHL